MPDDKTGLTIVVSDETAMADEEMSGEMLAPSADLAENSADLAEPAPADGKPMPAEPAPAEPAVDVAKLISERDEAVGRAAQMEVDLVALRSRNSELEACVADMSARIASFELGAALTSNSLPASAGPLVKMAYDSAMMGSKSVMPIGEWLSAALQDPKYAGFLLMRGQQMSDPRTDVVTAGPSASPGRTQFPSFAPNRG